MWNRKAMMIILLIVGFIKNDFYIIWVICWVCRVMTTCCKNNIKVEFDFSNYAIKSNVKNAAAVGRWTFAKKVDSIGLKSNIDKPDIDQSEKVPSGWNSLKSKVDKLDIGKLETTPVDLSKFSDLVKNDVVTRTEYDELVKLVIVFKTTDTSNLV